MAQEDVEVVRGSFDAYAERGLDGLAASWDPDLNWRAMEGAIDDVGEINGREAMLRYLGDWLEMFEEISVTPHAIRDLGDGRVLAQQEVAGRAKLSGAETRLEYWVMYTVRDGKVVRGREYATAEEALAGGT